MSFWDGKKVLVTGGAGFVGSHLVEQLLAAGRGAKVTVVDDLRNGSRENLKDAKAARFVKADLLDFDACRKACRGQDVVLNLAARVGGVGYNAAHPGTMFRDNMALANNMIEAARLAEVERFLVVSTACVYSRTAKSPTPESEGFAGWPEDSNEGYGWAKRMAEFQATAYHKEFGMKVAIARPYNCYGPRDHFDSEDSHVIAALVRRIVEGENPVRVWGDGTQTRAFLYVDDFARGLLEVAERYAECDPLNIGPTDETSIADLVGMIRELAGSKARVEFDASKPSGQPRRNCDTSKARAKIGYSPRVPLREGLRRTIEWYRSHRGPRPARKIKETASR
ncbi:MAG: NAD-dependent epimerase/dehydratase family protein [Elusimicrobia bacterium]|nr:NAD-dependent epimerase/dehydratase family protein [Elusimicrobiota bacterium]